MKLALDFDNTFTAEPAFWQTFITFASEWGHSVVLVTARCETKDGINWDALTMNWAPCPIIWCDGKPKREVAKGIDIWIDDDPYSLVHGSQFTPEALAAWREKDVYRNPAHRPEGAQGPAHLHGRPGLFSARSRGDRGGLPQGERSAQSGATPALGAGEVNGPR